MDTKYRDCTNTVIRYGDIVEINTQMRGYIGEVVFEKQFGKVAVHIRQRRTSKNPERWKPEGAVHDIYTYLDEYTHKNAWIFRSKLLKPVTVIKHVTDKGMRYAL